MLKIFRSKQKEYKQSKIQVEGLPSGPVVDSMLPLQGHIKSLIPDQGTKISHAVMRYVQNKFFLMENFKINSHDYGLIDLYRKSC